MLGSRLQYLWAIWLVNYSCIPLGKLVSINIWQRDYQELLDLKSISFSRQEFELYHLNITPKFYWTQVIIAVIMIIMIKIMSTRLPVPNSSILKFSISIVYVLMQGTYPYINCCLIQDTFWNSSAIDPFTPGTFARCLDAGGTGVRLSQELAFLQWRNLNKTWECKGKLPRRNSWPEK